MELLIRTWWEQRDKLIVLTGDQPKVQQLSESTGQQNIPEVAL